MGNQPISFQTVIHMEVFLVFFLIDPVFVYTDEETIHDGIE